MTCVPPVGRPSMACSSSSPAVRRRCSTAAAAPAASSLTTEQSVGSHDGAKPYYVAGFSAGAIKA